MTKYAAFLTLVAVGAGCANTSGDGSALSSLTSEARGGFAGPSVGRETIVYQSLRDGNDDVFAINSDGTNDRRLTTTPASDAAPFLSANRKGLTFASSRDGNNEIYVSNTRGEDALRLTNNTVNDFHPVFFHNSDRILFQRQTAGTFDLWVMDADGANAQRVTTLPANEIGGVLNADDSRIAFGGNNGGNQDIWVANVDGTSPVNITLGTCTLATAGQSPCVLARDNQPNWTPDGSQIVFQSDRSGFSEIWVMNADGSSPRQVTSLQANSLLPSVSHNGLEVAFVSNAHNTASPLKQVYVVGLDGSNAHRVTFNTGDDLSPQFAY